MRMPPAASKKPPLTPEQIELLRKWIKAGAKYEPHWAYIPPQRPAGAASEADGIGRGTTSIGSCSRSRKRKGIGRRPEADRVDADAPVVFRSDRLAADAGAGRRSSSPTRGLMRTRAGRSSCWRRPRLASAWRRGGSISCGSPTTVGYHGDQDHRITPYRDYVIKSVQRQSAVQPVHDRAAGRRFVAEPDDVAARGDGLQPRAADDARRRRTGRRVSGDLSWPTACGIFRKRGWPARWAAPSATITSSIRTRRKIFTAWRRSLPTWTSTARSQPVGGNDAAHAAAAGDARLDAAGLRKDARRSTRRSPRSKRRSIGLA